MKLKLTVFEGYEMNSIFNPFLPTDVYSGLKHAADAGVFEGK